jgi:phosphoglycolate phosphatase-like HAD superfamily hydrolase
MQKRAVIFDFDGVFIDSEPLYFRAYKRINCGSASKVTLSSPFWLTACGWH